MVSWELGVGCQLSALLLTAEAASLTENETSS